MTSGIRRTLAGITLGSNNRNIIFKAGDVAATGNSQGTAAPLLYPVNNVTASDGTKAVVLPSIGAPGHTVKVYNSVATSGLPIYPPSSGTINGGSANAAVTIEGKTLATFVATSSTNWAAQYTADS
jgi:hypothetical protein